MILGAISKVLPILAAQTAATNATASARCDLGTLQPGQVVVQVYHTPATATNSSAKFGALDVRIGNTTTYSEATAVSGLSGTTNSTAGSTQFVIPVHNNTSDAQCIRLSVNRPGDRGRYLFITFQAAASHQTIWAEAQAFNLAQAPNSASEMGVGAYAAA